MSVTSTIPQEFSGDILMYTTLQERLQLQATLPWTIPCFPSRGFTPLSPSPPYPVYHQILSKLLFNIARIHVPLLSPPAPPSPSYHHLPPGPLQQLANLSTCISLFPPMCTSLSLFYILSEQSALDYQWDEDNDGIKPTRTCMAWSPPTCPVWFPITHLLSLHVGHTGLPSAS